MSILQAAASGLRVQQLSLDTIAHNLTNVSTPGFKQIQSHLKDTGYRNVRLAQGNTPVGAPNGPMVQVGLGVTVAATQRLFTQGAINQTDNPLDIAISGVGFLQVQRSDGTIAYTRDGSLMIDGQGRLTTSQGDLVLPGITVPPDAQAVEIDPQGTVWAATPPQGILQPLGTLELARFPNPAGLQSIGGNLLVATPAAGQVQAGQPGQGGLGQLVPGAVEASTVNLTTEMTKMMEAQRAYQLSLRAVQTMDEMVGMLANIRQ